MSLIYFIFLRKNYRIIKIKDNKLDFICFLNNFINRKGVVGVVQGGLSFRCTTSNATYSYIGPGLIPGSIQPILSDLQERRLNLNRSAASIPKALSTGRYGPINGRDSHDKYINNTLIEELGQLSINTLPLWGKWGGKGRKRRRRSLFLISIKRDLRPSQLYRITSSLIRDNTIAYFLENR